MDDSLYDDFGNYIGDVSDDESDALSAGGAADDVHAPGLGAADDLASSLNAPASTLGVALKQPDLKKHEIVLHEDKQYYPEASELYGAEVAVLVQEEDTQPITEPIIPPARTFDFDLLEPEIPGTSFSFDNMAALMGCPDLIRNVCFVGHLASGKTSFLDMLVRETHAFRGTKMKDWTREMRFTDCRKDENERELCRAGLGGKVVNARVRVVAVFAEKFGRIGRWGGWLRDGMGRRRATRDSANFAIARTYLLHFGALSYFTYTYSSTSSRRKRFTLGWCPANWLSVPFDQNPSFFSFAFTSFPRSLPQPSRPRLFRWCWRTRWTSRTWRT